MSALAEARQELEQAEQELAELAAENAALKSEVDRLRRGLDWVSGELHGKATHLGYISVRLRDVLKGAA